MEKALDIQNLYVFYNHTIALENVSLTVEPGEFVAITGPNGGGKTTLIKAILNLVPLYSGEIDVFGHSHKAAKGMIGYVPQQSEFDPHFPISVRDVVLMGRMPATIGFFNRFTKSDQRKVNEVLDCLGILNLASRPINELSGGQRQKVLLARALVTDPKLLILDEPTANIDPPSRKQIYHILQELNKKMTILMISHDDQHIMDVATSNVFIDKRVIYKGNEFVHFEELMYS